MSEKKKILIFIDWFLPGYKAGGPIRSLSNLIDSLHEFYEFYIVTSDRDLGDDEPYKNTMINVLIKKDKYSIIYLSTQDQTLRTYKGLIKNFEFSKIYLNSLFSFKFTILPLLLFRKTKTKVILAPRGMLGKGALNLKKQKKILFLGLSKIFGLYKNIRWHATNQAEQTDILKTFGSKSKIIIAGNIPKLIIFKKNKSKEITKFFFLSRVSKKKNLKFALEVFSDMQIRSKVQFDIFGPVEDKEYWKECEKYIKDEGHLKINYKGEIDHIHIEKILSDHHFFFLPTLHENYGHVIFEALSLGCPVIISDQTPWRNLEEKGIGQDLPLSNKEGFKNIIQHYIDMDQNEYDLLSENAYKFALKYSKDNDHIKQTKKLFD